jgi:hypothetical protein
MLIQSKTTSGKRVFALDDGSVPRKRPRQNRVVTQRAREAQEDLALLKSLGRRALGHAFPRNRREWEIEDLEDVQLAEDGSVQCLVMWKPTVVNSTALVRSRIKDRLEQLFKERYGMEEWEKRHTLQPSTPDWRRK